MKVDDSLANTRGLLTQWGRWVRSGGSGVSSYRCPLGSLRGGGVPSPVITDDVALRVDAEVLALKARMPTTGTAVELYYSRPAVVAHFERGPQLAELREARPTEVVDHVDQDGLAYLGQIQPIGFHPKVLQRPAHVAGQQVLRFVAVYAHPVEIPAVADGKRAGRAPVRMLPIALMQLDQLDYRFDHAAPISRQRQWIKAPRPAGERRAAAQPRGWWPCNSGTLARNRHGR